MAISSQVVKLSIFVSVLVFKISGGAEQDHETGGEQLLLVGLVLPIRNANSYTNPPLINAPCGSIIPSRALAVNQFMRLVDLLNGASFLRGFRITVEVIDTCSTPSYAMAQIAKWGSAKLGDTGPPLAFVITNGQDDLTAAMAVWFRQFGIPVIDFNSTAADLSDRVRYPLLARTVTSDKAKAQVLATLIGNVFEWRQVNLVYSHGLMGESGAMALRQEFVKLGVRIVTDVQAPWPVSYQNQGQFIGLVNSLDQNSDVPGVVCFCNKEDTLALTKAMHLTSVYKLSNAPPGIKHVFLTSTSFDEGHKFNQNELPPDGLISVISELPRINFAAWFSQQNYSSNQLTIASINNRSYLNFTLVPDDVALGSLINSLLAGAYALRSMIDASLCIDEKCKNRDQLIAPTKTRNVIQNGSLFYNTYLRHVSFDVSRTVLAIVDSDPRNNNSTSANFHDFEQSPFTFDGNVEQPARFKFVLFAEDTNSSLGGVVSEEFGDYSAARKHINLFCSELVGRLLFSEQHVDCRREMKPAEGEKVAEKDDNEDRPLQYDQTVYPIYHYGNLETNKNLMVIVSTISSIIFLIVSVGIVFYHIHQTKREQRRGRNGVIVLRELPHEIAAITGEAAGGGDSDDGGEFYGDERLQCTNLAMSMIDEEIDDNEELQPITNGAATIAPNNNNNNSSNHLTANISQITINDYSSTASNV